MSKHKIDVNWILVFVAGIMEVFWPIGLKYSNNVFEWAGTIILIVGAILLLVKAYEKLPAGTVYAVFTGMGTIGIFFIDTIFLNAVVSWQKILFLSAIIVGVIGLKLVTKEGDEE